MRKRFFIRHKGFNVYVRTCRVSDAQVEAAKAELAAAAAPATSVEKQHAAAKPASLVETN